MALKDMRNLVFEGGGVRGIAYVGALQALAARKVLPRVRRFCGASAGSITAWLCCYYKNKLEEIEKIQKKTDFKKFADDSWGIIRDSHRLLDRYGWHKGDKFYEWAQGITQRRFKRSHITFQELFEETGNELVVTGCNISQGKTVLMSRQNTPDLFVERALRISMSIPIYYRAIFIRDLYVAPNGNITGNPSIDKDFDENRDIFVDGGVLDNYPIQFFDRPLPGDKVVRVNGRTPRHYNKSTLGLRLDTPAEFGIGQIDNNDDAYKAENFFKYLFSLVDIIHSHANKRHLDDYDWHRTIRINTLHIKSTTFDLKKKDQEALIAEGRKATNRYLSKFEKGWKNF